MALSLSQANTLIVDDFQGMRSMLREFVKAMGISKIDTAANGKEALALLKDKKFDIVICDYNLGPGANGQQVLEEAKQRKYIGYATIWVMVTAEKTMDMFMGAAETKPDDYLLKPVNEALLEGRLQKLIAKKQSLEAIEKAVIAMDYPRAIALCEAQLKSQQANVQDLLRIQSDLLLTVGDLAAAKALFEKVLAIRNVPWAKTGMGKVYFHSQEYFQAKEIFQEVLDENRMYLEATDWLVKTLEALGDTEQSQQILSNAMALSPNSAVRQKKLADVAYRNGALDVAQASYEKAIKLSEHSIHKNPEVYAGLAKVLTDKDSPEEAIKVLDKGKKEFKNDPQATLQVSVIASMAYEKMGRPEKAREAMDEAARLAENLPGKMSVETSMDMAKALFKMGDKEKASELLQNVVMNNHENADVINQVEGMFQHEQMGEEGRDIIKRSKQEVVSINNQGVLLAKEGKFEDGILLLRKALTTLSNNAVIILNLCGMLIGLMSKNGKDDRMVYEVRELLDRAHVIDPSNKKYHEYVKLLSRLVAGE